MQSIFQKAPLALLISLIMSGASAETTFNSQTSVSDINSALQNGDVSITTGTTNPLPTILGDQVQSIDGNGNNLTIIGNRTCIGGNSSQKGALKISNVNALTFGGSSNGTTHAVDVRNQGSLTIGSNTTAVSSLVFQNGISSQGQTIIYAINTEAVANDDLTTKPNGNIVGNITFEDTGNASQQIVADQIYGNAGNTINIKAGSVFVNQITSGGGATINLGTESKNLTVIGSEEAKTQFLARGGATTTVYAGEIHAKEILAGLSNNGKKEAGKIVFGNKDQRIYADRVYTNNAAENSSIKFLGGSLEVSGAIETNQHEAVFGTKDAVMSSLKTGSALSGYKQDLWVNDVDVGGDLSVAGTFHDTGSENQRLHAYQLSANANGDLNLEAGDVIVDHRIEIRAGGDINLGDSTHKLGQVVLGSVDKTDPSMIRLLNGNMGINAERIVLTGNPNLENTAIIQMFGVSGNPSNSTLDMNADDIQINGNIFVGKPSYNNDPGETADSTTTSILNINSGENSSEDARVVINGNIVTDNRKTDAMNVKGEVNIGLYNDQSSFTGSVVDNVGSSIDNQSSYGTHLTLEDGAQWTTTSESTIASIQMKDGAIDGQRGSVTVANFEGTGSFTALATTDENGVKKTTTLTAKKSSENSKVHAIVVGGTADDVVGQEDNLNPVQGIASTTTYSGGDLYDEVTVDRDAEGNVTGTVGGETSSKLTAFKGVTASSLVQWRNQINHVTKRLGDVRQQQGEIGAWARVYGGEYKWSDENRVDMKSTTVQVGGDGRIGDWIVGGAFSYSDSSFDLDNGDGDGDLYSLAVYGTRMFDSGAYIDLVARYGYLKNDLTAGNMDVDFKSNAFGVSVESGHQFKFMERAYVEPQIEVSYGYVQGDDAKASNGVKIEQDDYQSLVTRIGFRTGFDFPEDAGTIYAHASYSYDFLGDADATARKGDYRPASLDEDLGGGWVTYGIGGQFKIGQSSFAYGEIERSTGGDVENPWAFNIGFRHLF